MKYYIFILLLTISLSCQNNGSIDEEPDNIDNIFYFPQNESNVWDTETIKNLRWNENAIEPLKTFLEENNSKSFMILVNGKIVLEEYFNNHTVDSAWEWNSAGKTLISATTGIAQQQGFLDINNPVSDYLGTGWTNESLEQEALISSKHLLNMTSGINDEKHLVIKSNLTYLADAGTRWSYHNVFKKLTNIVTNASNQDFDDYFDSVLKNKIGMTGTWVNGVIFKTYHSNTRSMARFGLLALNNGKWNHNQIINEDYFTESINTSQNFNPSYGYLWWLNGKTNYMLPGSQTKFNSSLIPNAPTDMYAAMGTNEQRIYVIPSKNMVVVRMGEASNLSNTEFALSDFDNDLWEKINRLITQ